MTSEHRVASGITADDLARVARTRVFFGHQSVGMNVLDNVPGIYAARRMATPAIEQFRTSPGADGGFIWHAFIGANERPAVKIEDFEAKMRSGVGECVDVAMLKFCYVDVMTSTDATGLLRTYRETIAGLERDFPAVAFVHVTVPLMTEQGQLSRLKSQLTGSSRGGPAENVARERLNSAIRRQYASRHLFDLAAIESTAPDGRRAAGTHKAQPYYRLYDGYAADSGHLNAVGGQLAAAGWLTAIARASLK